jgi:membrane-bound lytic murein transglycosylase D
VDYKLLKELNPTYKKYVIPQTTSLFYITIPSTRINHFYELGDEVYVYTAPPALPILEEKEKDTTVITPVIPHEDAPVVQSTTATVYYKVRKGDILLRIADLYDCEVNELRQWNNIRGNKIIVNQRLKIVVPSSKLSYYKKMDKLPKSELNRIMLKD